MLSTCTKDHLKEKCYSRMAISYPRNGSDGREPRTVWNDSGAQKVVRAAELATSDHLWVPPIVQNAP